MTSAPTFACIKASILLAGMMVFSAQAAEVTSATFEKIIRDGLAQPDKKVAVEAGDYPARLEGCDSPNAFLPYPLNANGGRTTVGFNCAGEHQPPRYVPVNVRVTGAYWVPAHDIERGSVISLDMLTQKTGDLSRLPRNVVLYDEPIVGQQVNKTLKEGSVIQKTSLQAVFVVKRNAVVEVQAIGTGFTIKREGVAMDNGAVGGSVRVKLKGGEVIRGNVVSQNLLKIDI